jgi:hypothetical protein
VSGKNDHPSRGPRVLRAAFFLAMVTCYCAPSVSLAAQGLDQAIINSAVFIRFQKDPTHETRGSGFIMLRQISSDASANTYTYQILLVTNKHMLPPEHGAYSKISLRIMVRDANQTTIKDVPIDILDAQGLYLSSVALHSNPRVDVAAIDIGKDLKKANSEFLATIMQNQQAMTTDLLIQKSDMKDASVGIGTQIYMLGFPGGVYDARNAEPLLRIGVISTEPDKDYSFDPTLTAKYGLPSPIPGFLIDANVYPGSSGSLVIRRVNVVPGLNLGGKGNIPYALGIVADSIPIDDLWGTSRMGLGVVFGADTIRDTINLLPTK